MSERVWNCLIVLDCVGIIIITTAEILSGYWRRMCKIVVGRGDYRADGERGIYIERERETKCVCISKPRPLEYHMTI